MRLDIEFEHHAASRMLADIGNRLERPQAALSEVGQLMVEHERAVFSSGGRGDWAPLDEATRRAKGTGRLLVDTGGLLAGLTSSRAINVSGDSVSVGTSHRAAKFLRGGTSRMPARNPTPSPDSSTLSGWADVMGRALVGGRL